jgi:Holliday junction resolvase RusA-like endonuclease
MCAFDLLALFFSKYKDAFITVGWLLAALGWYISNRQANRRERRKETRSEIDAIVKAIFEVITKLRTYYGEAPSHPQDDVRSAEIAFEVKRILTRSERLNTRLHSFQQALTACEAFFEGITKEPFASKNRSTFDPGADLLRGAEESAHNLVDKLEEGFDAAFPG